MNTSQNWKHFIKPHQQQQTLMHSFISTVTSSGLQDMNNLTQSLSLIDKTLSKLYAPHCYDPNLLFHQAVSSSYSPSHSLSKLSLPKGNTLTDALIRNTLGCDQKYAKQYVELLGETEEQLQKKKRIDQIKKQFTQSNTFVDVSANSKPFLPKNVNHNPRPVVDNQHQSYLKTQLILMQKPNNSNVNQKNYYQKHYEQITQQIQSLGGIQDTLSRMESTLKNNEINNLKNRSLLKETSSEPQNHETQTQLPLVNPQRLQPTTLQTRNSNWLQKSKHLRQQFTNTIHK